MDRSLWLEVYVHILYIYNGICAYIIYICISPCAKVQHTHTLTKTISKTSEWVLWYWDDNS